jgi:hypothetical protein
LTPLVSLDDRQKILALGRIAVLFSQLDKQFTGIAAGLRRRLDDIWVLLVAEYAAKS